MYRVCSKSVCRRLLGNGEFSDVPDVSTICNFFLKHWPILSSKIRMNIISLTLILLLSLIIGIVSNVDKYIPSNLCVRVLGERASSKYNPSSSSY